MPVYDPELNGRMYISSINDVDFLMLRTSNSYVALSVSFDSTFRVAGRVPSLEELRSGINQGRKV